MPADQKPIAQVYRLYETVIAAFPLRSFDPKSGLGGKLLYAGEIDGFGSHLLHAGNIAGFASLAASSDSIVQRQAIRDGVIDFLVNSLEEALRILKNEIRKHETVSVGVAIAPQRLVAEMKVRGVLPDLVTVAPPQLFDEEKDLFGEFVKQGSHQIEVPESAVSGSSKGEDQGFVTWTVDRQFARWLPLLDQRAQAIVPDNDELRRRWLRLSPRYLGKLAQRLHGVAMDKEEFIRFQIEGAQVMNQSRPETEQNLTWSIEMNANG